MYQKNLQTVIVTGGAKRVGRHLVENFANSGWNVVLHCNGSLDQAKVLEQKYSNIFVLQQNLVCDEAGYGSIISRSVERFGCVDLLVNNASVFDKISMLESTDTDFDTNFAIHVKAPFFLAKYFALHRKKLGQQSPDRGHIINFADTKVTSNKTTYFPYLLSKKSLVDLSDMMGLELSDFVRVNTVLPGATELSDNLDESYIEKRVQQLPLKARASLDEIWNAVKFLQESTNLTGQKLYLDAGESLLC